MTPVLTAWLAAGGPNQPNGHGQEFGSSGPIALILIIVLFVAVAFLIRSMTKHLKKVPPTFDPDEAAEHEAHSEDQAATEQEKQDH
jgi:hypothetical protein